MIWIAPGDAELHARLADLLDQTGDRAGALRERRAVLAAGAADPLEARYQLARALARSGDVFVGISTSGKSPNILAALKAARERKLVTIGFTRDGQTPMSALCDVTVGVPAAETALIQQIHITAAHAICHLVERALFGAKG